MALYLDEPDRDHPEGDNHPHLGWQASSRFGTLMLTGVTVVAAALVAVRVAQELGWWPQ